MTDQVIEESNIRRIHVGNLALASTEADVHALFAPYGEVRFYERPLDRDSTVVSGYAYVGMADAEALQAIAAVNGQQLDGQALRVTEAKPPRSWQRGAVGPNG